MKTKTLDALSTTTLKNTRWGCVTRMIILNQLRPERHTAPSSFLSTCVACYCRDSPAHLRFPPRPENNPANRKGTMKPAAHWWSDQIWTSYAHHLSRCLASEHAWFSRRGCVVRHVQKLNQNPNPPAGVQIRRRTLEEEAKRRASFPAARPRLGIPTTSVGMPRVTSNSSRQGSTPRL